MTRDGKKGRNAEKLALAKEQVRRFIVRTNVKTGAYYCPSGSLSGTDDCKSMPTYCNCA